MNDTPRLAIVTAAISLVATLAGTFLGNYLSREQRAEDRRAEQKKEQFEYGKKLLERMSIAANTRTRAETLWAVMQENKKRAAEAKACAERRKSSPGVRCALNHNPYEILAVDKELNELNANYVSTLQLIKMHFGPVCQEAAAKLGGTLYWDVTPERFVALMKPMQEELRHFNNGKP